MRAIKQLLVYLKKNYRIDSLTLILIVIILPIAIYKWTSDAFSKKEVFTDYSITYGWISDYSIVGDASTRYLTYTYNVNGIDYKREINPKVFFDVCAKNIALCGYRRFWVIYSNKDHSKSLIDLTEEIQGRKENEISKPFPKTIDNFE